MLIASWTVLATIFNVFITGYYVAVPTGVTHAEQMLRSQSASNHLPKVEWLFVALAIFASPKATGSPSGSTKWNRKLSS